MFWTTDYVSWIARNCGIGTLLRRYARGRQAKFDLTQVIVTDQNIMR